MIAWPWPVPTSFVYPLGLFALILLPFLFAYRSHAEKKKRGYGFPSLTSLQSYARRRSWQRDMPIYLRLLTLACLIVAATRPQGGDVRQKKHVEGLDIVLVLDTSQSMLAMDFKVGGERKNRLEVVKQVVGEFISSRPDDRIGLVVFGTTSTTQAPLTMDHQILQQFLKHIAIGMAGPETAIGDGLATGVKRLKDIPAPSKVLILLTDGDNTAGTIDPLEAAQLAKTLGIKIYTIAVGTNEPVPFPVQGFWGTEYRPQVFKVNTELMNKIAELTGGQSYQAKTTEDLKEVYSTIDKLEKAKQEFEDPIEREELAWVFLCGALFFLASEQLWLTSRQRVVP
ncbi:MAG: VWA domain-containing protein [Bdellovibrionota bacterium]